MSGVPTVGAEEPCWISSSEWSQQEPNGSGIWEEGDIGLLTICFSSFEGYEFASQVEYQSESAEAYGATIRMIRFGKNSHTIQIEYPPIASAETLEEIASVTVTMDEPARGEAVSKEITAADSADYTVLQYRWSGNSGSVWKSREVPKATITLQAKEGYRFRQDIARDDINAGAASISGVQVEEDGEVLSFVATFPTIASSSSTYPGGNNNRGDGIIGIIIPSVTPTPTPVPVIPTPVPTAVPSAAPQPAYPDLASVPWAQEAIGILSERGIVSGYEDNTFRPEQSITREEFVKLVVLQMYAGELDPNAVPTYLDAQNGWYSPYLALAENKGIIRGTGDGLFGVAGPITRQDMAVILYEVLKREGYQPESRELNFTDCDEIAPYAQESVGALSGQGVIRGYEDGSFAPNAPASRAETSVILYRIMQLLDGNVE